MRRAGPGGEHQRGDRGALAGDPAVEVAGVVAAQATLHPVRDGDAHAGAGVVVGGQLDRPGGLFGRRRGGRLALVGDGLGRVAAGAEIGAGGRLRAAASVEDEAAARAAGEPASSRGEGGLERGAAERAVEIDHGRAALRDARQRRRRRAHRDGLAVREAGVDAREIGVRDRQHGPRREHADAPLARDDEAPAREERATGDGVGQELVGERAAGRRADGREERLGGDGLDRRRRDRRRREAAGAEEERAATAGGERDPAAGILAQAPHHDAARGEDVGPRGAAVDGERGAPEHVEAHRPPRVEREGIGHAGERRATERETAGIELEEAQGRAQQHRREPGPRAEDAEVGDGHRLAEEVARAVDAIVRPEDEAAAEAPGELAEADEAIRVARRADHDPRVDDHPHPVDDRGLGPRQRGAVASLVEDDAEAIDERPARGGDGGDDGDGRRRRWRGRRRRGRGAARGGQEGEGEREPHGAPGRGGWSPVHESGCRISRPGLINTSAARPPP